MFRATVLWFHFLAYFFGLLIVHAMWGTEGVVVAVALSMFVIFCL